MICENCSLETATEHPHDNLLTSSDVYGSIIGTKNRQKQTADLCKQHLREKYADKLRLVEEFIVEIEGPPQNFDLTRWGQFADIKRVKKEMLRRLEIQFENWLN